MGKYREEMTTPYSANIFDKRSGALVATSDRIHDSYIITILDDVEFAEGEDQVTMFNDICNDLFTFSSDNRLNKTYKVSAEDYMRSVTKPFIDEIYGSKEFLTKLYEHYDKQINKGENKMFDSAQPQWEKVLDKLRDVVVRPMRDSLEYQACMNGKIEEIMLDFCQQYESICTHHENPRYFLGEWIELYKTAFKAFEDDNALRNELMDIMVSDEWFDLIRWFDKEYEDFDEE